MTCSTTLLVIYALLAFSGLASAQQMKCPTSTPASDVERPTARPILWTEEVFGSDFLQGVLEEFVNRRLLYQRETENNGETENLDTEGYDEPAEIKPFCPRPGSDERVEIEVSAVVGENDGPKTVDTPQPGPPAPVIAEPAEAPTPEEETPRPPPVYTAEALDEMRFAWADKRFAAAIAARKGARGLMVLYADDQFYDIARLQSFIDEGRDRLASKGDLNPDRIEVIFGGYRPRIEVEFWIIPAGGKQPEPKPEERETEWDN